MLRWAQKILRTLHVRPEEYAVLRNLKRLYLTGFEIYPYKAFQPEHVGLKDIIKPGMKVVDVGASIGDYSILFARWGAHVTAIEPTSSFHTLRSRVAGCDILCLNLAVGAIEGTVTIYESAAKSSVSKEWARSNDAQEVELQRLDSLISEPVDFVKIDVEGMEMEVLRGAERILKQHKPIVFCEINELALRWRGTSGQEILVFMEQQGYEARIFSHVSNHYDVLFKSTNRNEETKKEPRP